MSQQKSPCNNCELPKEYKDTLACAIAQIHNATKDICKSICDSVHVEYEAEYECPFEFDFE